MSIHSCVVHDFPLPDREYYAAASDQWDEPTVSKPRRPAPSRIRRGKRRSPLPLLALTGLMLFAAGFLLGGALTDRVFEPLMAAQGAGSPLAALFGMEKGSGAALLFAVIGVCGVAVCLAFGWAVPRPREPGPPKPRRGPGAAAPSAFWPSPGRCAPQGRAKPPPRRRTGPCSW